MTVPQAASRWVTEFGLDYDVPGQIIGMEIVGEIDDQSWHNDICPSFGLNRDPQDLRIWIEHVDPERREGAFQGRFAVVLYDDDGSEIEAEFHTDDIGAAIERWREFRRVRNWS